MTRKIMRLVAGIKEATKKAAASDDIVVKRLYFGVAEKYNLRIQRIKDEQRAKAKIKND